jgi:hypothetical protein
VTIAGTAGPGATVAVVFSSGASQTVTADPSTGAWSVQVADAGAAFGQGLEAISVFQRNAAGSFSPGATRAFTVDTQAPAAPGITTPDAVTNNLSQSISGTAEPGSLVTVLNGATVLGTTVANEQGKWATTVKLGTGISTLTATSTDAAGNTASSSNASAADQGVTFTVDTEAPVITLERVANAQNGLFDGGFKVTAGPSAVVSVTVNGAALDAGGMAARFSSSTNAGVTSYTARSDQFTGSEVVVVSAAETDTAGNVGRASWCWRRSTRRHLRRPR